MLKFTYIVGYTSCGTTYIESFLTIFGQCINALNYNCNYPVWTITITIRISIVPKSKVIRRFTKVRKTQNKNEGVK